MVNCKQITIELTIEYITNMSKKNIYRSLFKAEKKTRLKYIYYYIVQSQVKNFAGYVYKIN